MADLRRCPFCGEKAYIKETARGHSSDFFTATYEIGCANCKIFFRSESKFSFVQGEPKVIKNGYAEAEKLWNRRVDNG